MSLEFTLVRRAISLAVIDGPDADDEPDILQAQGSVLFEPVIKKGDSIQVQTRGGSETYALAPIECPINDGIISHRGQDGVKLPAGGEAANPSLIRWKATFSRMQAGGKSFTLAPVIFDAIPGGEVDLTLVAPVAGTPEGIVRGPRGTSLESIIVDGSELVFTAVDDEGSFEIVRIPLDDVVRAEADAAADGVRDSVKQDADRAEAAADRADARVDTAINDGAILVREEMRPALHANAAYLGQSLAASQMATDSANAAKSSENKAKSWAELSEVSATSVGDVETRVKASETSASESATSAASSESNARISADAAVQSENRARSSAAQAQNSESSAMQYADAAAQSAQLADPEGFRDEIEQRVGLVEDELDGKAPAEHTHTSSQVDGLDVALARLDNIRAWFRGAGPPPSEIPGARVGDWWLDTDTMELHEITEV